MSFEALGPIRDQIVIEVTNARLAVGVVLDDWVTYTSGIDVDLWVDAGFTTNVGGSTKSISLKTGSRGWYYTSGGSKVAMDPNEDGSDPDVWANSTECGLFLDNVASMETTGQTVLQAHLDAITA